MSEFTTISKIRDYFSGDRKCCSKNCLVTICKMPIEQSIASNQDVQNDITDLDHFTKLVKCARAQVSEGLTDKEHINFWLKKFEDRNMKPTEGVNNKWSYVIFSTLCEPLTVCRSAFSAVYGVDKETLNTCQRLTREGKTIEFRLLDQQSAENLSEQRREGIKEAFLHFGFNSQDYPILQQNIDKCPDTPESFQLVAYLEDVFYRIGDQEPNSDQTHLPAGTKMQLYEEYDVYMKRPGVSLNKALSYVHFTKIWSDVFDNVKIREWKSVSGKCSDCEMLSSMRGRAKSNSERDYYKALHALHRNHTKGEKYEYYKNTIEAIGSDGLVLSLILDGMTSSSTNLPNLANQCQFPNPFETHLQGCIAHGSHTTFYWSFKNLMTGASFMIYCILCEIRKIIDSGKPLPKKIYAQIDGGSENTSRVVVAFFEHLIILGLCMVIVITRLPVGHTHEDIDSRFGVIWVHIRRMHVYTPEEFEKAIKASFPVTSHGIEIVKVIAIANYMSYYLQFIDKNVQNYSKLDRTQLRFQIKPNTNITSMLPVGALTQYKRYAQAYTVTLIPTSDASRPFLPQGKHSIWQPECGMSFLITEPTGIPDVMPFTPWADSFVKFLKRMNNYFPGDNFEYVRKAWRDFALNVLPTDSSGNPTDDVNEYILSGHDIDLPLSEFMFVQGASFRDYKPTKLDGSTLSSGSSSASASSTASASSSFLESSPDVCGFEGRFSGNASSLDTELITVWHQVDESVEWRGMKKVLKDWRFDHKFIYNGVMVERGNCNDVRMRNGTIMAYCPANFNDHVALYKIKFDDGSAEYNLPETDYPFAREEYLKCHPAEINSVDESRRAAILRAEIRNLGKNGRGEGGRRGRGRGDEGDRAGRGREGGGRGRVRRANVNVNGVLEVAEIDMILEGGIINENIAEGREEVLIEENCPGEVNVPDSVPNIIFNNNNYKIDVQRIDEHKTNVEDQKEVSDVEKNVDLNINHNSNQSRKRNSLQALKFGNHYPCGCGICDKSYEHNGNMIKCVGCSNMYVNKKCGNAWKCMRCLTNT